jgi:hypothetical protein
MRLPAHVHAQALAEAERRAAMSEQNEPRQPTYRDAELMRLVKALRASVRPFPGARIALERVEGRLRYVLRVVETWDRTHETRARDLIRAGCLSAANTAAGLIFDPETRAGLLRQCFIGGDGGADERMAENMAAGREVLA